MARHSLEGLVLGDAFGQSWFVRDAAAGERWLAGRVLRSGPWKWTDDAAMALVLYGHLTRHGEVRPGELAGDFAAEYARDPYRQYGASMHEVLERIGAGEDWRTVTGEQFGGQGSWGNGAAMRVAPLGAWFHRDLGAVVEQARLSALATHAHPQAVAGAVAVAVAAALAAAGRGGAAPQRPGFLREVADLVPEGRSGTSSSWRPSCPRGRRCGRRRSGWGRGGGSRRRTPCRSPCGAPPGSRTICPRRSGGPWRGGATATPRARSWAVWSRPGPGWPPSRPSGGPAPSHYRCAPPGAAADAAAFARCSLGVIPYASRKARLKTAALPKPQRAAMAPMGRVSSSGRERSARQRSRRRRRMVAATLTAAEDIFDHIFQDPRTPHRPLRPLPPLGTTGALSPALPSRTLLRHRLDGASADADPALGIDRASTYE